MLKLITLTVVVALAAAELYEDYVESLGGEGTVIDGATIGVNEYFRGRDMNELRRLLGARLDIASRNPRVRGEDTYDVDEGSMPTNWRVTTDARWANCKKTTSFIKDQADCGSCWAVAASSVAEDRTCIANVANVNSNKRVELSAADIMDCCTWCGDGCQGGYPIDAMRYWNWNGVVTGGYYGSNCGCEPYQVPPCGPQGCQGPEAQTPACSRSCRNGYSNSYSQDKHMAKDAYQISQSVSALKKEMFQHGSFECAFTVYKPFFTYKSGVMGPSFCRGQVEGGHAITFAGYGVSNGVAYWDVKNSWNASWGMQGWFRVQSGINWCGIEEQCVAGIAKGNDNGVQFTC